MFQDPHFWVSLSFILFIVAIYKPASKIIVKSLDARSYKIQNELDEALKLKEEAQALLASYQRKQKEITQEAEKILASAHEESKRLLSEAEKNLEDNLNKKILVAMQKIASYENSVLQGIRLNSVDVTMTTIRKLIEENINSEMAEKLVRKAISEMEKNSISSVN